MPSGPCDALNKQGYLFFSPQSSAALKPCLWCKRALAGGEMCYKHQFYGIDSHRCVQMTPTLRCNQRCLFCWRSFEHEPLEVEECSPADILAGIPKYQKKALAGYNAVLDNTVTDERWKEALDFERQSGPYIQYAHARACSILEKAGLFTECYDMETAQEIALAKQIAKFPQVIERVVAELRPHILATYARELADTFNSFYHFEPVLTSEKTIRDRRLTLVKAAQNTLKESLETLGIDAIRSM